VENRRSIKVFTFQEFTELEELGQRTQFLVEDTKLILGWILMEISGFLVVMDMILPAMKVRFFSSFFY